MSFTLCCHNPDVTAGCTISFPEGPLTAILLDIADEADPTTGSQRSLPWGKFHVTYEGYVMHSLSRTDDPDIPGQKIAELKYSSDGGATWEVLPPLPYLAYPDLTPGDPFQWITFPRKWDYLGGALGTWELWTFNDRNIQGYFRSEDNGQTWRQWPMADNTDVPVGSPLKTNRDSGGRSWGLSFGDDLENYYQLGQDMYNSDEPDPAYRSRWQGIWEREKGSSDILREFQLRNDEFTNCIGCEKMEEDLIAAIFIFNDPGRNRLIYSLDLETGATSNQRPEEFDSCDWNTDNRRYIMFTGNASRSGEVHRWDVRSPTLNPPVEILLPGQYGVTTACGYKPYLWTFASFISNDVRSNILRLFYSRYSDASMIESGYVEVILPYTVATAQAPVIKGGEGGYWYVAYRTDQAGFADKWVLVKFLFEILNCPPSSYTFIDLEEP